MPQYEYVCHSCKNAFSKILTIAAYEEDKISCPKCDSKDVEQAAASFYAVTSKKSA
jgi:putative FmdB family regulatory protein